MSIGPTIPEICPIECLTLKNTYEILKNIRQKWSFQQNVSEIYSGNKHGSRYIAAKFCINWLSDSYFMVQIITFLLINTTTMTLGQGHWKVIQYIFTALYFLCPKYLQVWLKLFWCEKQKSLQRQTQMCTWTWKQTDDIKSPQTMVT